VSDASPANKVEDAAVLTAISKQQILVQYLKASFYLPCFMLVLVVLSVLWKCSVNFSYKVRNDIQCGIVEVYFYAHSLLCYFLKLSLLLKKEIMFLPLSVCLCTRLSKML